MSAVAVVDLLRRGEVTPHDLLNAREARVALVDPVVNALPTLAFPAGFYLFFGVAMGHQQVSPDMSLAKYWLATYGAFGVVSAALFVGLERAVPLVPGYAFETQVVTGKYGLSQRHRVFFGINTGPVHPGVYLDEDPDLRPGGAGDR